MYPRKMLTIIGLTGMLAVIIGAFGAHGLKPRISAEQLTVFHTGVSYHFNHVMAMAFAFLLYVHYQNNWSKIAFWSFLIGIILFSGSLYLLSTRELIGLHNYKWLGPMTPIGGVCFIFGWISILISGIKSK